MDAPKVLDADDLEGFGDLASLASEAGPDGPLRGWWSSDVARTRFRDEDLDLSLAAFRDILAKDSFDVSVFRSSSTARLILLCKGCTRI